MRFLRSLVRWTALSLGSLCILIMLAGMVYRWTTPAPHRPLGQRIQVNDTPMHLHATGAKSAGPTVVIENGSGLPTEFYHWLSVGLQDSLRVVRYDRAGLGHSDECITPRDPDTIAEELHTLLEKAGEAPPYLLVGHSLGGPYIRVFAQRYPDEVAGLVFLDATHHHQVELFNAPQASSLKFKALLKLIGAQAAVADLGILALYDHLFGSPYVGEGLPDTVNQRFKEFLRNGKSFRGYRAEMQHYHAALKRSAEANDFGDLPICVINAAGVQEGRATGLAPEPRYQGGPHPSHELARLSTQGKLLFLYGNHSTIFTKQENAALVCKEILSVARAFSTP